MQKDENPRCSGTSVWEAGVSRVQSGRTQARADGAARHQGRTPPVVSFCRGRGEAGSVSSSGHSQAGLRMEGRAGPTSRSSRKTWERNRQWRPLSVGYPDVSAKQKWKTSGQIQSPHLVCRCGLGTRIAKVAAHHFVQFSAISTSQPTKKSGWSGGICLH